MSDKQSALTFTIQGLGNRRATLSRNADGTIGVQYQVEAVGAGVNIVKGAPPFKLADLIAAWTANQAYAVSQSAANVAAFIASGGMASALPHPELSNIMVTYSTVLDLTDTLTITGLVIVNYGDALAGFS